ncbi:MAG: aldo/keto reductase [Asgard group archaeon]|nr:aldo/keto reductase [Asgard group archaeon]
MSKKIKLPKIGLGTMSANSKKAKAGLVKGIEIGFRFLDTAQMYFNEKVVGQAMKESGVPREEFILATKLWITNFSPKRVIKTTKKSLNRLGLDYIDMLYLHWPHRMGKINKTLDAMNKLVDDGLIKHIAVSNFTKAFIEKSINLSKSHIVANQVEMHPWLQQKDLLSHHDKLKVHIVSYFPLMHGRFMKVLELQQIAEKHNISAAQVSLAWIIAKGAIPIPKSTTESHLQDNFDVLKIKLDKKDIKLIDSITRVKRFANFPIISPKWDD